MRLSNILGWIAIGVFIFVAVIGIYQSYKNVTNHITDTPHCPKGDVMIIGSNGSSSVDVCVAGVPAVQR